LRDIGQALSAAEYARYIVRVRPNAKINAASRERSDSPAREHNKTLGSGRSPGHQYAAQPPLAALWAPLPALQLAILAIRTAFTNVSRTDRADIHEVELWFAALRAL
jgi:hypothetical protein